MTTLGERRTRRPDVPARPSATRAELRATLVLAGPVVLAELGWMGLGVADLVMVGPLGPGAIAAAGIGNILFFAVAVAGIGLLLGLDTLVSQAYGAGRVGDCHRALVQGLYLSAALSPPMVAALLVMADHLDLLRLDPTVTRLAVPYLRTLAWGLPPLLAFTALRRYLQAMDLARPVLVALLVANAVNAAGNWVLVHGGLGGPRLGVVGSAWATFGARLVMAAHVATAAVRADRRRKSGLGRVAWRPDGAVLLDLTRLGAPVAAQITLELGVFAVAAALAGRLGAVPLAAHEVVLHAASVTFMIPLGISSAAAVRVGQAIGRGAPRAAALAGWIGLGLGAAFMAVAGLAFAVAPRLILGLFTADPGVVALGRTLLLVAAVWQLFDGLQVVASGALRGAGDTRTPMAVNLGAHWMVGLPIGAALAFPLGYGLVGLWLGLALGLIVAGLALLASWAARSRRLRAEGGPADPPAG